MKIAAAARRGRKRKITFQPRRIRYSGNGLRSVTLEKTLAGIEKYFLNGDAEAQFEMIRRAADGTIRAVLQYLPPQGEPENQRYFGKGATAGQTLASACMEFIERQSAKMKPGDRLLEASFPEVASAARDPILFSISAEADYKPAKRIDWIWGYSLTRSEPVLVPANLVFFPYEADRGEKYITWTDTNGLASGNNLEEAVLHGILEVIERDAVVIAEYNRLPFGGIKADGLSSEALPILEHLEAVGYSCAFRAVPTDISVRAAAAFLRHEGDSANCCVAFGCHLNPGLAMARALTEAIQLLPPSVNHAGWLNSGSPEYYAAPPSQEIPFDDLRNLAVSDLKDNIEKCVAILKDIGSEAIVVDLSLPDIPFPAVRVLATALQPLLHEGDMRLSRRFFEVPIKLGLRSRPLDRSEVRIWPLCGYR
jgi:thiazole/oxazole-forming peptide maturase SagD family component